MLFSAAMLPLDTMPMLPLANATPPFDFLLPSDMPRRAAQRAQRMFFAFYFQRRHADTSHCHQSLPPPPAEPAAAATHNITPSFFSQPSRLLQPLRLFSRGCRYFAEADSRRLSITTHTPPAAR
jgi:hypothetical protein